MQTSSIDLMAATDQLTGCAVGHTIHLFDAVPSTMPIARAEIERIDGRSGLVVVAEEQSQGRGRYDRRWVAPRGTALLTTIALKPPQLPSRPAWAGMAAALAVADAIAATVPTLDAAVQLKWPNDIMLIHAGRPHKVAGVLAESAFVGTTIAYVLVGIGVNVNQDSAQLADVAPSGVASISLARAAGQLVDRTALLVALCRSLAGYLAAPQTIFATWRVRLATIDQTITVSGVEGSGEQWRGRAAAVDEDGRLVLELVDGSVRTFSAGDVTLQVEGSS